MAKSYVISDYQPRRHQLDLHKGLDAHRWSVVVAHRRFGKTVCMVNHLIKAACECNLPRPQFAYLAPTYSQAKKVAWEYVKHYTQRIPGVVINESELWVRIPHNDAKIMLCGADNPDSLRGIYLDGCVMDEVAQMKPGAWQEVVRPALSDRKGWAVFIGTPKGVNLLYDIYLQAQEDELWYSAMFKASETGVVAEDELEAARKTMGEAIYLQEYECDWTAANSDTVIPFDLVDKASNTQYAPDSFMHRPLILGVDPARFGDDRSALVLRQGLYVYRVETYKGLDTMELASRVNAVVKMMRPDVVFVDSVGVGAGVADRLRQLGHDIVMANAGHKADDENKYTNKRSEMWFRVKQWLQDGGSLPENKELREDLLAQTYSFDNKGRIQLEKKSEMKKRGLRSPDLADALALTFYTNVEGVRWNGASTNVAQTEYDYFGDNQQEEPDHFAEFYGKPWER